MRFKCCDFLLHEIVFAQSQIMPCCSSPTHTYENNFIVNYNGASFDINQYKENRNRFVQMFKDNIIPKTCEGCSFIQDKEWDETFNINRIIITNRTKCSCDCMYCSLITTGNQTKEELNTRETYDVKPVLEDLYKKNIIKENANILVAGGECSEYPKGELEYIVYFASLMNCKMEILSSGIIFSKAIKIALQTTECKLIVSVDSGTKETYEKIKRISAYKKVWENMKKYVDAAKYSEKSQVILKYIIIPGINDNINEAKSFINKCMEINCKNVEITIEYNWFYKNKDLPATTEIKEIVQYFKNSGMQISYEGQSEEYLKKI